MYSNTKKATALLEKILYNLAEIWGETPGSSDVIGGYIEASKVADLQTMVGLLLAELEYRDDVVMGGIEKNDENVKIPWEESGTNSGAGCVGARQFCKNLFAAQWATLIYNYYKDSLSVEDIALLESYGAIILNVKELAQASAARQNAPLIIHLNQNNFHFAIRLCWRMV